MLCNNHLTMCKDCLAPDDVALTTEYTTFHNFSFVLLRRCFHFFHILPRYI